MRTKISKAVILQQRLIDILIFKSGFINNPGLFYGKMGLTIFFAHYNKYTSDRLYETIADELMEQVLEETHKGLSLGIGSGLSGIGWGIEYLIQNGFMEGDCVEICEEIDCKIMETDPRRLMDMSLEDGLEGLLNYVLAHIKGAVSSNTKMPFDDVYMTDLFYVIEHLLKKSNINEGLKTICVKYANFFNGEELDYEISLRFFLNKDELNFKDLSSNPIGLKNGISGYMLRQLLTRL